MLLLFSLFIDGNENSTNKALVEIVTGAARIQIARTWKDAQGLSFQTRSGAQQLMEKLTTWGN